VLIPLATADSTNTHRCIRAGHKSVDRWQKLPGNLPLNLPGVNSRGDGLITHTAGYLCPIVDVDGLIIGFQVRKRHLVPDDDQRYYFLSQNGSIRISDQVPLAVFEPIERKADYYGLVEGVGSKPFLACDRLGVPTIGAAGLEALQARTTPLDPEEKRDLQKTLLFKWFGQELIEATVYEHDSGEVLTGYAAMALKNERGVYRQQLENFYLSTSDEGEAIGKDIAAETSQLKHNKGRFPGDIRWRSRQRKARAWLGLPDFLNPEKWYEPNDYRAMGQKAAV
jgi:hypothetical protein